MSQSSRSATVPHRHRISVARTGPDPLMTMSPLDILWRINQNFVTLNVRNFDKLLLFSPFFSCMLEDVHRHRSFILCVNSVHVVL